MEAARPQSRLRNLAGKVAVLGITSAACVLLLEVGVRWLLPFYSPSSQIGFVPTTNGIVLGPANSTLRQATPKGDFDVTSRFNGDGFRDIKDFRAAGPGDWFALGDSFTMGWGVAEDERFSNQLEMLLAGAKSKAHVFNIAIPDNIIGYQRLLRYAEGRGAKASRLVVGICMENDLQDYSAGQGAWDTVFGGPGENKPPPKKDQDSLRGWMKNHSALYNAVSFSLQRSESMRRLLEKLGVARNVVQLSGKNEWNEKAIAQSAAETVKLVSGREAFVLIIPARLLWAGDNRATEQRVHEAYIAALTKAGVRVVDMKPALEQTGDPLGHYFKSDAHWNARGHALAAQELMKVVGPVSAPAP